MSQDFTEQNVFMEYLKQTNHKKTIVMASDHNGVDSKYIIKKHLIENGYHVIDLGPFSNETSVDYVNYASQLATIISNGDAENGILICGTGMGMCIVANRFKNVRAALAHNMLTAIKSKEHNNSNVLCLGSWVSDNTSMLSLVDNWLNEKWAEGRHVKRVEVIDSKNGIVLTNGVFDILHKGHIELLKFAKKQGNYLVVAIDSDAKVKKLKGPNRPINTDEDRKKLLDAIEYVDEVIIFNTEEELKDLYVKIKPSIIVKGSEWTADEIKSRDQIPNYIDIKIFPLISSYSTTDTLRKIKSLTSCEKE